MTISVVQAKLVTDSLSGSFTTATTAGNAVVVGVMCEASTNVTMTVTGVTLGGSADHFAQAKASQSGSAVATQFAALWVDPDCAGGQTAVVVAGTNLGMITADNGIVIMEVAGLVSSTSLASVLDKTASNSATTGTAVSSGTTATTAQAAELWVAVLSGADALSAFTGGWTTEQLNDGSGVFNALGYQVASATGAASFGATQASSVPWAGAVITLLGAAAGTAVPLASATSAAFPLSPPPAIPAASVTGRAFALAPPAALPVASVTAQAFPLLPPGPQFPAVPLGLRCELNLAGSYTDVTTYAYQRDGQQAPVSITRGRPDESSQANPSTCTWEWNNRDGRFSPKNPLSPYYGMLGRNTPVRWSVPAQVNYLRLENNSADRAFVSDNSRLDITGSIEMRIALRLSDWQGGILASKWDGGGCWAWQLTPAGTLTFDWFDASVNFWSVTSTVPVPYTSGDMALRVTMDATSGTVTFYTAATIDGTYTQLGAAVSPTGGATSIQVQHASPLLVGFDFNFTPGQLCGRLYEYRLYNGIGGTVAADAVFTLLAAGTTSFTDAQGNAWTIAGGAEISSRNYRFHGEMSAQPPKWDVTGTDMRVMAQAGGPLRRLSQGTANAMSAMKRAVLQQTGSLVPQAYWTLEDAAGASVFGAAIGPDPMTFDANPAPTLATDSSFLASAPLPAFNGSRFYGKVAPYTSGGSAVTRFLCKLGTVTLLPGLTYAPLARVTTSGTVRVLYVVAFAGGSLGMIGYDSTGATIVNTGAFSFGAAGVPLWYSAEIQLVAGNVQCSLVTLAPGASSGVDINATLSGGTVGNVTQVALNPNSLFTDTAVGHVTVQGAWSTLFALGQPLNAWTGETAGARYARLAGENGYQARIIGSPGQSALMGPQTVGTLSSLLTEVEQADLGQAFEPRQCLAIGYRTLASMLNQAPAVTLDYAQSQPGGVNGDGSDSGLDPTYDDLLLANDWTVTRGSTGGSQGATWQSQLNDGSPMSVSDPPVGAGDYAKTQTVNTASDSQLPDLAGWLVHTGTVDQARWPQVPVNLARAAIQNAGLYYPVLDADVGDYLQLLNLPDVVLYDPVRQLQFGSKELLGGFHHTVEWSAVPEVAFETVILNDAVHGTADTGGSTLASAVSSSATTLSVSVASGDALWTTAAADFPFDIAIAGERVTVTNVAGSSSPQSFTVTRAVNGVSKAQAAGADVRLWSAPILSLA